jgi:hypothetical protein
MVAVVDSGADGSLPQLAGHVTVGADIVTGSGHGDTDCLGTGTAMAGLIVAQPTQSSGLTGIAPDATVMPVRVVTTTSKAQPADEATAIEVATSAGATVIALGSYVDPNDSRVAAAVAAATTHDVVVVSAAPTGSAPVNPSALPSAATIRVGGVGVDGQSAAAYRAGAVDVVAPGVNVTSLGVTGTGALNGTGTQYAVAFVAGEAALVRAAYPDLTATQVVHRLEATADKMGDVAPDSRYGFGLIDPGAAVTKVLPEEVRTGRPAAQPTFTTTPAADRGLLLILIGLVGLAAAVLLVLRIRRLMRAEPEEEAGPSGPGGPQPQAEDWARRPADSLAERLTAAGIGARADEPRTDDLGEPHRD